MALPGEEPPPLPPPPLDDVFTVSVAMVLVTLPAELLTTTRNCSPLFEVVVTGVV